MKNYHPKNRGFTLLELLIAASIFAAAVVMIVGSFGISTKNQRQVRANRDVSQNIRYVSQEIARQVELSTNAPIINNLGNPITQDRNQVYNFAVADSPGSKIANNDLTSGDTLFVRGEDDQCRCYTLQDKRLAVFIDSTCSGRYNFQEPSYLTDEKTDITYLQFKGVMNQKDKNVAGKENQAYVWIIIESKSADMDFNIPLNTKTMATVRNYGGEK